MGSPYPRKPTVSEHRIKNWTIRVSEHHILRSTGPERELFENKVALPSTPEMIFDKNVVEISANASCSIHFDVLEALKLVNSHEVTLEVPIAKEWRAARADQNGLMESLKHPYDWTFTTTYSGTLKGPWTVEPHPDGLDMETLKRRDPILFYVDTNLFEDELGDNGLSILNIKIRVMESGFFVLQRFFLRVDGGLVRTYDTRLQWRSEDSYIIRDIRHAESSSWTAEMAGVSLLEADQVCDRELFHTCDRLQPFSPSSGIPSEAEC